MKPIHVFFLLVVAALAGAGGWWGAVHFGRAGDGGMAGRSGATGLIYTCSMHPQVRQPTPGNCPFCGMALAPLNSVATNLPPGSVMLSSNRVNAIHVQSVAARRLPLKRSL